MKHFWEVHWNWWNISSIVFDFIISYVITLSYLIVSDKFICIISYPYYILLLWTISYSVALYELYGMVWNYVLSCCIMSHHVISTNSPGKTLKFVSPFWWNLFFSPTSDFTFQESDWFGEKSCWQEMDIWNGNMKRSLKNAFLVPFFFGNNAINPTRYDDTDIVVGMPPVKCSARMGWMFYTLWTARNQPSFFSHCSSHPKKRSTLDTVTRDKTSLVPQRSLSVPSAWRYWDLQPPSQSPAKLPTVQCLPLKNSNLAMASWHLVLWGPKNKNWSKIVGEGCFKAPLLRLESSNL